MRHRWPPDGCRVPIPWSGEAPSYGFGPGSASWLPQPAEWAELSVERQQGVDGSTWEFYREALRVRRAEPSLGEGPLEWLDHLGDVLAMRRTAPDGSAVVAIINLNNTVVHLPAEWGTGLLIASSEDVAVMSTDESGTFIAIGPETAAWLRA